MNVAPVAGGDGSHFPSAPLVTSMTWLLADNQSRFGLARREAPRAVPEPASSAVATNFRTHNPPSDRPSLPG